MVKIIIETDGITAEILSIIKRAKKEIIIVSPYIKMKDWPRLNDALSYILNNEENRDIKITIITRNKEKGNNLSIKELNPYLDRCKIYLVNDLHSKLYLNEKKGLVTSMNMYQHSAERNHEIGVLFEKYEELQDLKEHAKYLMSAGEKFISDFKIKMEEEKLKKSPKEEFINQKFQVISKGRKWLKVETEEGYENKILIGNAPGLKEGCWYKADVIKKWKQTPYGLDVEYVQIKNICSIFGYCIICGKEIKFNLEIPMCKSCYFKNKKFKGHIYGKKCHRCGKKNNNILDCKPLCRDCFFL